MIETQFRNALPWVTFLSRLVGTPDHTDVFTPSGTPPYRSLASSWNRDVLIGTAATSVDYQSGGTSSTPPDSRNRRRCSSPWSGHCPAATAPRPGITADGTSFTPIKSAIEGSAKHTLSRPPVAPGTARPAMSTRNLIVGYDEERIKNAIHRRRKSGTQLP